MKLHNFGGGKKTHGQSDRMRAPGSIGASSYPSRVYRGQRLVNWDPVLGTALSDLEVINQEEDGHLWHLRYPLADGSGYVVVATTRPETMLGDTGVAVHPEDERYRHLVGKAVRLPLVDRLVPIVADADSTALGVALAWPAARACEVQARSHLLHLREGFIESGGEPAT